MLLTYKSDIKVKSKSIFFTLIEKNMPHLPCVCGYANMNQMPRNKKSCPEMNSLVNQQRMEIDRLELEIKQLRKQVECKDEKIVQTAIATIEKKKNGYNYIIHTREAIRVNENVYKIGRCKNIANRFRQYPKGSILMYSSDTSDHVLTEDILIKAFHTHFVQRKDYGNEYFEGDIDDFIQMFDNVLHAYKPLQI